MTSDPVTEEGTTASPQVVLRKIAGGESRATFAVLVAGGASLVAGILCWALGAGIVALWLFSAAAVAAAIVLPWPLALASPLYMAVFGWLVDMLPLVVLVGWTAVVLRWLAVLAVDRRLPRGGRWIWLPVGLFVWTAVGGLIVVSSADFKHFLLLVGIQFVASGVILAVVDTLSDISDRMRLAASLLIYVLLLTVSVAIRWTGVPVESLQDETVSERVESAYGVDAFQNSVGMIRFARNKNAGAGEWRREMRAFRSETPGLPAMEVFLPKFHVYDEFVMIRFAGSARPFEEQLDEISVDLLYDNIGLAPANMVPRWRSFPRNALTYAGLCAALFPFAFFFAWNSSGRRRLLGRVAAFACLMGAGFAIARGAWVAILLGIIYLCVDGLIAGRRKLQAIAAYVAAALLLTTVFFVLYNSDPLTARATGDSSITTRQELYQDTVQQVNEGLHLVFGYGVELPRLESGTTRAFGSFGRYVPRAGSHSTYLNYLFRAGLVGAAGIVLLYVAAFLHARRAGREWSGRDRSFATLAATAMIVVMAHAVILSLYVEPVYTLVVSLVVGLAMAGTAQLNGSILPWRGRR